MMIKDLFKKWWFWLIVIIIILLILFVIPLKCYSIGAGSGIEGRGICRPLIDIFSKGTYV
jgi:hypothetical protein